MCSPSDRTVNHLSGTAVYPCNSRFVARIITLLVPYRPTHSWCIMKRECKDHHGAFHHYHRIRSSDTQAPNSSTQLSEHAGYNSQHCTSTQFTKSSAVLPATSLYLSQSMNTLPSYFNTRLSTALLHMPITAVLDAPWVARHLKHA